ncbi:MULTISPECIES: hypothetical protein [unclassified Gordonia (in: high G+C Gram-positive bacteria)]|uniref:hypothetical protein n=1 Tax=unclassified Gordonia (in: high G+C Gram-positive bacteria) TaxID=2657482 RepID=UPI0020C7F4F3|nr:MULTISPECIES: hypothetical protein [unclassified Gordonia (in: high G+C Gram-positive bacteria)]
MSTAWADESGSRPDMDPGAYLMSAALCDEDDVDTLRNAMEVLRLAEPKVHWHGSSEQRRTDLVTAVAELPLTGFVVVHVDKESSDRRHRRKCMEFLLPHLADMPCVTITLESRGQQDASDMDMLHKLRARHAVAQLCESTTLSAATNRRSGSPTSSAVPWCNIAAAAGTTSTYSGLV